MKCSVFAAHILFLPVWSVMAADTAGSGAAARDKIPASEW